MSENLIQLLSEQVSNQIAAGEVVQRPSSVVKELVENAVDAEATSIKVHVRDSGKSLIQVVDNGKGMNAVDAQLCFERHATSKIKKAEDLFQLQTKGFRGEALASIASVAQVELLTCNNNELNGFKVEVDGGKQLICEEITTQKGSVFSVKNLFFNICKKVFFKVRYGRAPAHYGGVRANSLNSSGNSFCIKSQRTGGSRFAKIELSSKNHTFIWSEVW